MAIMKGQLAFNVELQSIQNGVKRWIQCVYAKLQPRVCKLRREKEKKMGNNEEKKLEFKDNKKKGGWIWVLETV